MGLSGPIIFVFIYAFIYLYSYIHTCMYCYRLTTSKNKRTTKKQHNYKSIYIYIFKQISEQMKQHMHGIVRIFALCPLHFCIFICYECSSGLLYKRIVTNQFSKLSANSPPFPDGALMHGCEQVPV